MKALQVVIVMAAISGAVYGGYVLIQKFPVAPKGA